MHAAIKLNASWRSVVYKGRKLDIPFKMCTMTVTQIQKLGSTLGHPATLNDKTIMLFNSFVKGAHHGKVISEF